MMENSNNKQQGQSLIEVLVAIVIVVFLVVAITGLAMLSTRILIESERQTVALGIVTENIEKVRSSRYEDIESLDIIGTQTVDINGQTYEVTTEQGPPTSGFASGPLTQVTSTARWTAPGGAERTSTASTYIAEQSWPSPCGACGAGTSCDSTTGLCISDAPPEDAWSYFSSVCVPGLLCPDDGSYCNVNRKCPGYDPGEIQDFNNQCRSGEICSNGGICSTIGECPTQACDGGGCGAGGVCMKGWCYSGGVNAVTFPAEDATGPASSIPNICQGVGECSNSAGCPQTCRDGSDYLIWMCDSGWIPKCGGGNACRGGWALDGSCTNDMIRPEACPAPSINTTRAWCPTSNEECQVNGGNCPGRESGNTNPSVGVFWGGYGKACRPYRVKEVLPDQVYPVCSGAGGAGGAGGMEILIENEDATLDMTEPIEVLEGGDGVKTQIIFDIKLASQPVDTVMANLELIDGTAKMSNLDFGYVVGGRGRRGRRGGPVVAANRKVLIWEPDEPLMKQVTVEINGDTIEEENETFVLRISRAKYNPGGVSPPPPVNFVILNDDVTLQVAGITVEEKNTGQIETVNLELMRLGATIGSNDGVLLAPTRLTASVVTEDGTAIAGSDYTNLNLVPNLDPAVFPPLPTLTDSRVFTVDIIGDNVYEQLIEQFKILPTLIDTTNLMPKLIPGVVQINDNEPEITFAIWDCKEATGQCKYNASMSRGTTVNTESSITWYTVDGTADSADYSCAVTAYVPMNQINGPVGYCSVTDDDFYEGTETFEAIVSSSSEADYAPGDSLNAWILDNDPPPS